jgi:hypothetical protein
MKTSRKNKLFESKCGTIVQCQGVWTIFCRSTFSVVHLTGVVVVLGYSGGYAVFSPLETIVLSFPNFFWKSNPM